ncbi:MAG: hypothetical protein DRJ01_07935 [Bacteroidetes bacterium]|nr:MAG: hypothetical protein DRJ01_07935 [Bacteroidota bacterium]
MRNILKNLLLLSIIGIISFSCNDDASMIGLEIQPNSDKITVSYDSIASISAYTLFDDSMMYQNPAYSIFGSYVDPIFGNTKSGFTFSINPRYLNANFDDSLNLKADSLVIYFSYNSYYGDTLTPQHFKFYELTDSINIDSSYLSQINLEDYYNKDSVLLDTIIKPRPNDTLPLSIKLPTHIGQRFIDADTSVYSNTLNFIDFFKGFYLTTNQVDGGGSLLSYNLSSTSTVITLYYSGPNDTVSRSFDFIVNSTNRYNIYNHDYTNSKINNVGDSTYIDSVIYLQPMNGLKGKIEIPDLSLLTNQEQIIINKAELILETGDSIITQSDIYKIPSNLKIKGIDDDGGTILLQDYIKSTSTGLYYANQPYDTDSKSYKFIITQYIQDLIKQGKNNCSFYISIPNSNYSTNRVVLKNSRQNKDIKFLITYTKLQ